jgi:hypothetical protein
MAYCGPRGIPWSVFKAWAGEDRDAALWWLIHDRLTCEQCGTRPDEWDPEQGGSRDAYRWKVDDQCPGCAVLAVGQRRVDMAKEGRYHKDARVVLVPFEER